MWLSFVSSHVHSTKFLESLPPPLSLSLSLSLAQLAEAVEYTDCISAVKLDSPTNEYPGNDIKQSDDETEALGNAEYPFITRAFRFTLTWSGYKLLGPIDRSNSNVWHLNRVQTNDSYYSELFEIEQFDSLTMCNWIVSDT